MTRTTRIVLVFCFAATAFSTALADGGAQVLELDRKARDAFNIANPRLLPELQLELPAAAEAASFDWSQYCRDFGVHNQRDAATCWAHAAVEALECRWAIRTGRFIFLSPQPVVDRLQTNQPSTVDRALEVLLRHGTCQFQQYPYTGKVQALKDVPTRVRLVAWGAVGGARPEVRIKNIKKAILDYGPVITWMAITEKFENYSGGLLTDVVPKNSTAKGGHFVLIVGWDDGQKAWKIKNSWGRKWGEQGYAWVSQGSLRIGEEVYWVESQSNYYPLPDDAHASLGNDADSYTKWKAPYADAGDPVENLAAAEKLLLQSQFDEARGLYEKVLVRDRRNATALASLGVISWQKAIEFKANDQPIMLAQAQDRVETYAAMAIAYDANSPRAHYLLGLLARLNDDLPTAGKELTEAIRLDPNFAPAYKARGEVRIDRNAPDLAFKDFDRLIELDSTPENYELRAAKYEQTGNAEAAKADRQTAKRLRRGK